MGTGSAEKLLEASTMALTKVPVPSQALRSTFKTRRAGGFGRAKCRCRTRPGSDAADGFVWSGTKVAGLQMTGDEAIISAGPD